MEECSQGFLPTLYELRGIMAHIGSLNQGHYVTFCLIGPKWWMLDDSFVREVSTTAVFAENFPDPSSRQTAHILVHTLT
jgi:ubiquitin C-terminal hydrolase